MEAGKSAGAQGALLRQRADDHRTQAAESVRRAGATDHQADLWERGQVGEQTVGAALEQLREQGYDMLHDVRWPGRRRANIDHVAIGPAGILVVDAKNWSGAVSAHHGRLRQNGHRRDKELAGVGRAGAAVAALVPPAAAAQVISVLCLAGEHHLAPTRCAEVTVVDVGRLTAWVSGLSPQLSPGEVLDLAGELRRQLPPASSPVPRQITRRRAAQRGGRSVTPVDTTPVAKTPVAKTPVAKTPVAPQWPPPAGTAPPRPRAFVKIALLLATSLLFPAVVYWWSANGPDVMGAIFPASVPSVGAVAPVIPVYDSCRELRAGHPGGVAAPGAQNKGRKLRQAVVVTTSQSLYAANARLDSDGDGIACEVVRKRPNRR